MLKVHPARQKPLFFGRFWPAAVLVAFSAIFGEKRKKNRRKRDRNSQTPGQKGRV